MLTAAFQTFTFNIADVGSSLRVRVVLDERGIGEEVAFDDLTVLGTATTVAPPDLAGIETSDISYAEGQAATLVTNNITVAHTSNITSATVTISGGFRAGQDELSFTPPNGITGTSGPTTGGITSTTGTLTLTGSASPAAYRAALRTVKYRNSDAVNATGGRRTIRLNVLDGTNSSAPQSCDVVVTTTLAGPASIPYLQDFSADDEGTRYATNSYNSSTNGQGWFRTNANPNTPYTTVTFGGTNIGYYWYGEATKSVANPDPAKIGYLETQTINGVSYKNLHYLVQLTTGVAGQYDLDDFVKFYYRVAPSTNWTLFGAFYGNSAGELQRDTDLNGTADGGTGTVTLNSNLTNVDFSLPAAVTGIIDFRTDLSNSAL